MPGGRRLMEAIIVSYEKDRFWAKYDLEWSPRSKTLPRRKKRVKRPEYKADMAEYQQTGLRLNICKTTADPLYEKFQRLLAEWREQAAPLPSAAAMAMLPSYQKIIGMGEPALPLILKELKDRPAHLFWALKAISGVDPVPPEDRGRIDKMIEAWINWGRQKRIIE